MKRSVWVLKDSVVEASGVASISFLINFIQLGKQISFCNHILILVTDSLVLVVCGGGGGGGYLKVILAGYTLQM